MKATIVGDSGYPIKVGERGDINVNIQDSYGDLVVEQSKPWDMTVKRSHYRLSTEPKPTTGVRDGDDLLIVDTKEFYVYYKGTWYLL